MTGVSLEHWEVTRPMREKVADLKAAMLMQSPEELQNFLDQIEMKHFHLEGVYARWCFRKQGVIIIGKVHKKEHLYIVCKGAVMVTNGDRKPVIYRAGAVIISQPGTERAVTALEDSICMTIHRTDEVDLDKIEKELIEPDPTALFDSSNKLIASKQEGRLG